MMLASVISPFGFSFCSAWLSLIFSSLFLLSCWVGRQLWREVVLLQEYGEEKHVLQLWSAFLAGTDKQALNSSENNSLSFKAAVLRSCEFREIIIIFKKSKNKQTKKKPSWKQRDSRLHLSLPHWHKDPIHFDCQCIFAIKVFHLLIYFSV